MQHLQPRLQRFVHADRPHALAHRREAVRVPGLPEGFRAVVVPGGAFEAAQRGEELQVHRAVVRSGVRDERRSEGTPADAFGR